MKVIKVNEDTITFDNGMTLTQYHDQDCCESHYLDFGSLVLADFEGLEFDLNDDNFFTRIEDFGIALNPTNNFPIRVAGYGSNNGYYSSNISLIVRGDRFERRYDVSECQHYIPDY